jgi:hypothetical protein
MRKNHLLKIPLAVGTTLVAHAAKEKENKDEYQAVHAHFFKELE